jgi:hypothetical protein
MAGAAGKSPAARRVVNTNPYENGQEEPIMASEKKVILIFTPCGGKALTPAAGPSLAKLLQKGALFSNVKSSGDSKTRAAAGNCEGGETLWDAAAAQGFVVGDLKGNFDMCVLDAGPSAADVERILADVLETADRSTLIVVVADGAIVFYGPGIAKGKVVDRETCPCVVAPTVAYAANFPVPARCEAPVAYAAFKDINYKLNEFRKLQETILNMEAAMERKGRQPWDKHDCA